MFGISFGEMMLLVILGVVVIGPRDLPAMMRSLGRNISKLRRTATELRAQSGIDEILHSEGIHREVQDLQKLATGRILELGLHDPILPPLDSPSRPPEPSTDLYTSRRNPPRNREYPAGSPDSYDALPEDAEPYQPALSSGAASEPASAPASPSLAPASPSHEPSPTAGSVARGALPPDESPEAALPPTMSSEPNKPEEQGKQPDEQGKPGEQGPEDDKMMSLWEHLDELRIRLTRAALAYVASLFAAWAIKDELLRLMWVPFSESWKAEKLAGEPKLHFAAPGDAFMAYFKLSMIASLGLAAPVIFYQIWSFIAPGLYRNEKRYAMGFVTLSSLFFVGGALFGWRMAVPLSFQYFLSLTSDASKVGVPLEPTIMFADYLDFSSQMLLAFGIIFELPLLLTFLSIIGLVNYLQLFRFGRWFIMIAAILGAVLSPPDTTSMIVMTVPLIVLYFMSIGLAYVFGVKPSQEEIDRFRNERQEARKRREEARLRRAEEERIEREQARIEQKLEEERRRLGKK